MWDGAWCCNCLCTLFATAFLTFFWFLYKILVISNNIIFVQKKNNLFWNFKFTDTNFCKFIKFLSRRNFSDCYLLRMSCSNGYTPNSESGIYSKQVNTRMLLPAIDTPSSCKKWWTAAALLCCVAYCTLLFGMLFTWYLGLQWKNIFL